MLKNDNISAGIQFPTSPPSITEKCELRKEKKEIKKKKKKTNVGSLVSQLAMPFFVKCFSHWFAVSHSSLPHSIAHTHAHT